MSQQHKRAHHGRPPSRGGGCQYLFKSEARCRPPTTTATTIAAVTYLHITFINTAPNVLDGGGGDGGGAGGDDAVVQ